MKAFMAAVDPFHDTPILGHCGWPDYETGPSVVRQFKQSTTVKSLGDGGAIMVYTWPILNEAVINQTNRVNNRVDTILVQGSGATSLVGPTTIYNYSPAEAAASLTLSPAAGVVSHEIPNIYFGDGKIRLLGMGFEVHDVTADIYKQGTLTAFEVEQTIDDKETVNIVAQNIPPLPNPLSKSYLATSTEVCLMQRFPSTLDQIMIFPTSEQWDAREGAYVVVPFNGDNDSTYAEYRQPWINAFNLVGPDLPNNISSPSSTRFLGDFDDNQTTGQQMVFYPQCYAPVNSRGVFLTGLNANSTFTITTCFWIESFPSSTLSPLLPAARPSCPFDPKALALISVVMKKLPIAVPVKDNGLGEWFWEAMEWALPTIGATASAFFPEAIPLIAPATAAATDYAVRQTEANRKKKAANKAAQRQIRQNIDKEIDKRLKANQTRKGKIKG
jgi:hypothetical protein